MQNKLSSGSQRFFLLMHRVFISRRHCMWTSKPMAPLSGMICASYWWMSTMSNTFSISQIETDAVMTHILAMLQTLYHPMLHDHSCRSFKFTRWNPINWLHPCFTIPSSSGRHLHGYWPPHHSEYNTLFSNCILWEALVPGTSTLYAGQHTSPPLHACSSP